MKRIKILFMLCSWILALSVGMVIQIGYEFGYTLPVIIFSVIGGIFSLFMFILVSHWRGDAKERD